MRILKKAADWVANIRQQDDEGREVIDPKPLAIPAGFQRPETLAEQVQRLVQRQVSEAAMLAGEETWEEANDFDIDEDFDPTTPWETIYDPELGREVSPAEFKEHWPHIKEEMARNLRNRYRLEEIERLERQALDRLEDAQDDPPKPKPRGAGVSPAPSSDPPAEQS